MCAATKIGKRDESDKRRDTLFAIARVQVKSLCLLAFGSCPLLNLGCRLDLWSGFANRSEEKNKSRVVDVKGESEAQCVIWNVRCW